MEFSAIGRAALRSREGERLTAYKDSVGVWTISVGVTSATGLINVRPGLTITAEESDDLFTRAVAKYVDTVRVSLKRPVPQEFFDACVSLCYNIGQPAFARSTLVKKVNAGDITAVEQFLVWRKPAEIMDRRFAEYDQAKTAYAIQMPKARRSDKRRISMPGSELIAATPAPSAPQPLSPAPAPVVPPVVAQPVAVIPASAPETVQLPGKPGLFARLALLFKR